MKYKIYALVLMTFAIIGCKNNNQDKSSSAAHVHNNEPQAYTMYAVNTELFVEFDALVAGKEASFVPHITILGKQFRPITDGSLTLSVIDENNSNTKNGVSSPGIFRTSLTPKNAGIIKLSFEVKTPDFTDTFIINDVVVYENQHDADHAPAQDTPSDEVVFLKEQAWKTNFANVEVKKQSFSNVIRTSGSILPSQGDEIIITAKNSGIINFSAKSVIGNELSAGFSLAKISGEGLTENNSLVKYQTIKASFEKAKSDFERAQLLISDNIISKKEFLEIELAYKNAKTNFDNYNSNFGGNGYTVSTSSNGFIKDLKVSNGDFVEVGQTIAIIAKNKNLTLKSNVPQRYFSDLDDIVTANFQLDYNDEIFETSQIISKGKVLQENSFQIPILFKIPNIRNIIPGSLATVYLKTKPINNVIVIPVSSLIEEQGKFFVYVQSSGEGFQKKAVELGISDGIDIQITSGLYENQRVVTKGVHSIKLATSSGKMPAHGHAH